MEIARNAVVGDEHLTVAVSKTKDAVKTAAGALAWTVDPAELAAVTGQMLELRDQVDALMAQFMIQVEQSGGPQVVGLRTVGQLVGALTAADPGSIRVARSRGQWLRDFPIFEAAFGEGEISGSHLDLLRRELDAPQTHWLLVGDQEFFVQSARDCSFADFKKVAAYWLVTVDPDGDEPAEQRERTGLSIRKGRGGRLFVRGQLDALSGQALQTAVERAAQQLAIIDEEDGVVRSESERNSAALVELVAKGAARKDGSHPVPLISIVMSQGVAEYLVDQIAEPTKDPVPVRWNDIDGRCELIDGTPIHPKHALELFAVATFRRHVMDAQGRLIEVSVNARTFPAWMRNALHVQARGRCETPGCDAPHQWIQADHVEPHSSGGKTRLSNGQNQCAADNKAKTNTTGQRPWRDRRIRARPPRFLAATEDADGH